MKFKIAYNTDIGIKKQTNQDGFLIKGAQTDAGELLFVAVCDGMGGLSKGELASTQVLHALSDWFEKDLAEMLKAGFSEKSLFISWKDLLEKENRKLTDYGNKNGLTLGTTATAALFWRGYYYAIHIGDCRLYELTSDCIRQLTADHTVVAKEIAAGRMTPEQAEQDPRRNVLLQCIGASEVIMPDCLSGFSVSHSGYLLCSDGFRHVITQEEIHAQLNPVIVREEAEMEARLKALTQTVKMRQETDNITAVYIHT